MERRGAVEPPEKPLADGVVAVRLRREADVAAIAAAGRDPLTRRWLDDGPMDDEARRTSARRAEEAWRSGRAAPMVIADAVTDEPVGIVNLQFKEDGPATVAYQVFPAHRGRGIAPRAVRLLADRALGGLGLDRVLLEADAENSASIRVAEKCGFARVGSRTGPGRDGAARTTVVFARGGG